MNTSGLIIKLVESLTYHGDLPTNIKSLSWYCPKEGGKFEGVTLEENENEELEGVKNNEKNN